MRENLSFDFYYGREADQFNFYRIPKLLFTDSRFSKVSIEAKVLYGLMLDRMSLSIKNGWIDEENRVYIYFKLEDAMEYMSIGKDKGVKLFAELDSEKGCGLIYKIRQGLGKPIKIYVMNFNSGVQAFEKKTDEDTVEIQTSEKPKSGLLKIRTLDFAKTETNNTKINNTEISNNNPILSHQEMWTSTDYCVMDEIDRRKTYRQIICDNIDYDLLVTIYSKESVLGVVDIMLEAVCSRKEFLQINCEEIPQEIVKSQLLKLEHTHVGYVLECLKNNTTKIKNIKSYILTSLYNSLSTLEHYYTAEVNYDIFRKTEGSYE